MKHDHNIACNCKSRAKYGNMEIWKFGFNISPTNNKVFHPMIFSFRIQFGITFSVLFLFPRIRLWMCRSMWIYYEPLCCRFGSSQHHKICIESVRIPLGVSSFAPYTSIDRTNLIFLHYARIPKRDFM